MHLAPDPELAAFRQEVRAFIAANLPAAVRRTLERGGRADRAELTAWTRTLHARGWAVPHWPQRWGGTGWDPLRLMIFRDEIQRFPAPETLSFGTSMLGPVLYTFGSEAQQQRFLPRIATLEDWWCQGFSEPGAGSDLASLTTRAVREGEAYILDGQKAWTSYAQYADWMFLLARTDKTATKQRGISFLLVDLRSPGITIQPTRTIDGGAEVNEVFFDSVRVPAANLVGEEHRGWDYAKFLLAHERSGHARVGLAKLRLRLVREAAGDLLADPGFHRRLVALEAEVKALEMTQLRVVSEERRVATGASDPVASILKIRGSELQQAAAALWLEAAGPDAQRWTENDDGSDAASAWLNLRKLSIYGGSNEIQRTIIAKTVLGL